MNGYCGCVVKCTFAPMVKGTNSSEWFESWFDSRYYHLLYANRSETEARDAVIKMAGILKLSNDARVLDLACGKGRHAVVLAELGYNVTGVDLSQQSIRAASRFESEHLHFFVHDMRRPVAANYYDAVFNFFTSFGYFDAVRDNVRTLNAVADALKKNGKFVLDYFNSEFVKRSVARLPEGEKTVEGIRFNWRKSIEGEFCVKDIRVKDNDAEYHFIERVQLFSESQLRKMLSDRYTINKVYGGYDLHEFNADRSERMILHCTKR
jgi:SAM-dependent methyltransferase